MHTISMRVISASAANRKSRSRAISDEVQVSKNEFFFASVVADGDADGANTKLLDSRVAEAGGRLDEPLSRRVRTCVHAVDRTQLHPNQTILGHHVYAFLDSNLHGGHGESPHAICLPKRLFASPWGAVGATHQTVLERGTAEHSDRPHRGQASAAKSKSPEQGPSGPRWTRCDNRRNFLYNRSNCLTINPYTGIRETTHFSNRSG